MEVRLQSCESKVFVKCPILSNIIKCNRNNDSVLSSTSKNPDHIVLSSRTRLICNSLCRTNITDPHLSKPCRKNLFCGTSSSHQPFQKMLWISAPLCLTHLCHNPGNTGCHFSLLISTDRVRPSGGKLKNCHLHLQLTSHTECEFTSILNKKLCNLLFDGVKYFFYNLFGSFYSKKNANVK